MNEAITLNSNATFDLPDTVNNITTRSDKVVVKSPDDSKTISFIAPNSVTENTLTLPSNNTSGILLWDSEYKWSTPRPVTEINTDAISEDDIIINAASISNVSASQQSERVGDMCTMYGSVTYTISHENKESYVLGFQIPLKIRSKLPSTNHEYVGCSNTYSTDGSTTDVSIVLSGARTGESGGMIEVYDNMENSGTYSINFQISYRYYIL